ASLENWNGDGSQSNPYVISGYKFDNQNPNIPPTTQPLLIMKDIDYHCLITNNLFLNSNESSIHLENVSSIRIIENNISKCNNHGIIVEESNSVLVANNTIYQNNGNGILFNSSENSLITSNMIFDNMGNGTAQIDSKNIIINNNSIFNNNDNGIAPISSEDILISDNTIFNNNISGIMTDHSNNISIYENNIHDTTNYEGIVLISTENSSIFKNSVYNNSRIGIALFYSNKNGIFNNRVFSNNRFGILIEFSHNNSILSNVVYNTNHYDGIQLYYAENNNVSLNIAYENKRDGILLYASNKSLITNNTIYKNNETGITFHISNQNEIYYNLVYKNKKGMGFSSGDKNKVIYNVFCNSTESELYIGSKDNTIRQNDFYESFNDTELTDNGERNIFAQNHYNNWITPDEDDNRIVDTAFLVPGGANNQDTSPMVNPLSHILLPPFLITPTGGEVFSEEIYIQWEPSIDTFGYEVSYTLFYSSNQGISWYSIIAELTPNMFFWNISMLNNAENYLIKVLAISSNGLTYEITLDRPFTIENHILSPLSLLYPKDGDKLNDSIKILWVAVNDTLGHQITYSVLFSDNGIAWTLLAQELVQTSYQWNTNTVEDGNDYKIMLIARCAEGKSITFIQEGDFKIQNDPENPINLQTFLLLMILVTTIENNRKK
ncbi:MAG: right-handed parallel beta-helix repeat-containing protein, partial [Promethearchaeota archaeon]